MNLIIEIMLVEIKEVNVFGNLVYLCPNHHTEMDNGTMENQDREKMID